MGWNLVSRISIVDEEVIQDRELILTRAHAGITNSATIQTGDQVCFDGLCGTVKMISHDHVPVGSERSPNSKAYLQFSKNLMSFDDLATLMAHGWKSNAT